MFLSEPPETTGKALLIHSSRHKEAQQPGAWDLAPETVVRSLSETEAPRPHP